MGVSQLNTGVQPVIQSLPGTPTVIPPANAVVPVAPTANPSLAAEDSQQIDTEQGAASASLEFIESEESDLQSSPLGDRVETMDWVQTIGIDPAALKNYAHALIQKPEELNSVVHTLATALYSTDEQTLLTDFCKLSAEQQEQLKTCLQEAGCENLLAQINSGKTVLDVSEITALYYALQPIDNLISSSNPAERNDALFQIQASHDPFEILPTLQAQNRMSDDTLQVMNLSHSLDKFASNGYQSGLGKLSQRITDAQARDKFDLNELAKETDGLTLNALDMVLGNLLLDADNPAKAQQLLELLQRHQQKTTTAEDRAQLLAFGIEEKNGKLYPTDGKNSSEFALSEADLTQITGIASALAVPVANRSKDVQTFLDSYQSVLQNTKLLEQLTSKRNQLQEKANQVLEQLKRAESDLQEVESTLDDLDGLLKRFSKDGLTSSDIELLAKLGIQIRGGRFVKNKFYDANGKLIERRDIEKFLRAKQAELKREIAAKRQELNGVQQSLNQTDQAIVQTAVELAANQQRLDQAYGRLSPSERARFAPAYESLRQRTQKALLQAIEALMNNGPAMQLLKDLLNGLNLSNTNSAVQQTDSDFEQGEELQRDSATSQTLEPSQAAHANTAQQTDFEKFNTQTKQASVFEKQLNQQIINQSTQLRRRQQEREYSRQTEFRDKRDQEMNQTQLRTILEQSDLNP